jgi:hypothetical protein
LLHRRRARDHVKANLSPTGIDATLSAKPYTFRVGATMSDAGGRMTRRKQGCAVAVDVLPAGDDHSVIVHGWTKP